MLYKYQCVNLTDIEVLSLHKIHLGLFDIICVTKIYVHSPIWLDTANLLVDVQHVSLRKLDL